VANEDDIVSVGAPGKERRITNVAAGSAASDAATVGQLAGLRAQLEEVRRECGLPARSARERRIGVDRHMRVESPNATGRIL
jgi:hypothetical protein